MKKIVFLVMTVMAMFLLIGCTDSGGDTFVQEAPLPELTPTDGTNIIVSAEGESTAGLSYTNVGENGILVSCGDDCELTVNEASPVTTTDNSTSESEEVEDVD